MSKQQTAKEGKRGTVLLFDKESGHSYVWLIWGLKNSRCDLIAIATNNAARERYLASASGLGYERATDEMASVDHLYGHGLLNTVNRSHP